MKTRPRRDYRSLLAVDDARLVERPAPGAAPTAFRIWAAGPNTTDHGPTVFTQRSAELLLEEQARRGNLYSIDLDHLSLETNRPAESGRAAGWHKLEVRPDERNAPELWAVDVEWCADIKEGLEMQPPKWRYFSPAYATDIETGEVVSYTNTALCINPATWSNTQLATRTRRETSMGEKEMLLALKAMAGGEDEKAKKAAEMYATMGGDERLAALEGDSDENTEADAEGDEDPPSSKKPQADAQERAATTAAVAATKASKTAQDANVDVAVRLAKLEAAEQAREVAGLVERHKDRFTPATRAWAATQTASVVRSYIKAAPKVDIKANAASAVGSRGEKQGEQHGAAPRIAKHEEEKIDAVLGFTAPFAGQPGFGAVDPATGKRRINAARPSELRTLRAQKGA